MENIEKKEKKEKKGKFEACIMDVVELDIENILCGESCTSQYCEGGGRGCDALS